MKKKTFLEHSWINEDLIVVISKIHGKGVISSKLIAKGSTLMVWGGKTVLKKDFSEKEWRYQTAVPIDEERYLGLPISDQSESVDEFLNHSCDPNSWLVDEVTVVARRDILAGEEITVDFATWDDGEEEYTDDGRCSCGAGVCRGFLRADDWKRKDLQERYGNHFSPFLLERMRKLK